jgi:hypothetical protein
MRIAQLILVEAPLTLACALSVAGPAAPCGPVEYAQLKDANRKELTDEYCTAMLKEKLNRDLGVIQKRLFDAQLQNGARTESTQRDMAALGDAQVTCLRAAEAAAGMLQKKFKAARPACPN